MAKDIKIAENTESKTEQTAKEKQRALPESVYSANELAANAKETFGTRQECVAAALKAAGKMECTVSEAKEIVEKFMKREVQ